MSENLADTPFSLKDIFSKLQNAGFNESFNLKNLINYEIVVSIIKLQILLELMLNMFINY